MIDISSPNLIHSQSGRGPYSLPLVCFSKIRLLFLGLKLKLNSWSHYVKYNILYDKNSLRQKISWLLTSEKRLCGIFEKFVKVTELIHTYTQTYTQHTHKFELLLAFPINFLYGGLFSFPFKYICYCQIYNAYLKKKKELNSSTPLMKNLQKHKNKRCELCTER